MENTKHPMDELCSKPLKITKALKLNIRGESINVSSYTITQIPLLDILSKTESKDDDEIVINVISLKFLKYIIEYIQDQQKFLYFRKVLDDNFDDDTIIKNLKYLGMDKLIEQMYKSKKTINDMLVVYNIYKEKNLNDIVCVLHDDTKLNYKELLKNYHQNNILIKITEPIIEDNEFCIGIDVEIKKERIDPCRSKILIEKVKIRKYISKYDLIIDFKSYFITINKYCEYGLTYESL